MFEEEESPPQEETDEPPKLIPALTRVCTDYWNQTNGKVNLSVRLPGTPRDLANWWARNEIKPRIPQDNCVKRSNKNGTYWYCPYIEHCCYTLKMFLPLNPDFQDLIIDAKLQGLQWRGDSRQEFIRLVDEFMEYKKDPEGYRKRTIKKMKSVFKGS